MAKRREKSNRGPQTPPDATEAQDGQSSPVKVPGPIEQKITPSEATSLLADGLSFLRCCIANDHANEASDKAKQISDLLYFFLEAGEDCITKFAKGGALSDSVIICGRIHPSGHHAAVLEARFFIEMLWKLVDIAGNEEAYERFQNNPSKENRDICIGFKGFDPTLVATNWEQAKSGNQEIPGILIIFNDSWYADFEGVSARIVRERALADPAPESYKPTSEDIDILTILSMANAAMSQQAIENASMGPNDACLSRRNIQDRLILLKDAGLVAPPEGRTRLLCITDKGRRLLERA
jgi:predicted transcriptional regulator